jgi:cyclohexa-1,5-dienecarbonyl-CoA hydratase
MTTAPFQLIDWQASDGVARLTLRRPPLNIINLAMLNELSAALDTGARDGSLRLLILQADPALRVFSAGVDVADHTPDKVGEMIPRFDRVCQALSEFPAPTLAVVHGHALGGGCELALACDMIYADETANLAQPEIKLAMFAPVATLRLPRMVGYHRAAEFLFTGAPLRASTAAAIGLINRAVAGPLLANEVNQLAAQLQGLSAAALRVAKRALRRAAGGWERTAEVEQLYLQDLMATADANEGLAAFMEKRPAQWRNE